MNRLVDLFGREHTYLRISVTDRCNLRCTYCMPAAGIAVKPKAEILTFEEIVQLARVFAAMGIQKIRITGGEPLVRKNLEELIQQLHDIDGIETLAMTTNAVLLKDKVSILKKAGLSALNISLDSLKRQRFLELTLRDDHQSVLDSIEAVLAEGFDSLKLNVVVIRGKNDDELIDFVNYVKDTPINVRFIEFMPFRDNEWKMDEVVPYESMRQTIEQQFELIPLPPKHGDVAKDFSIAGHSGSVSFVTSMTESFCSSCNRLRLTSDGSIKSCLFYAPELNFRDALRSAASDAEIEAMITDAVRRKPEAHPPAEELAAGDNRSMVEIGG